MFGSFCCCILLCQTPTPFRPVAMVLAVEGPVELQRAEAKHRVEVMDVLQENDRLILADGQRAELLVLHDNHRERLKTNSQVVVKKRGCEPPRRCGPTTGSPVRKTRFPWFGRPWQKCAGSGLCSAVKFRITACHHARRRIAAIGEEWGPEDDSRKFVRRGAVTAAGGSVA